jgi:hypothetical protein
VRVWRDNGSVAGQDSIEALLVKMRILVERIMYRPLYAYCRRNPRCEAYDHCFGRILLGAILTTVC